MLDVLVEFVDDLPQLRLSGALERGESSESFTSAIHVLLDGLHQHVICDVAGVSSIDSTGIGALVAAHALAHHVGGRFILIRPSVKVRSVLHTMRLIGILEVLDDERAAVGAIRERPQP